MKYKIREKVDETESNVADNFMKKIYNLPTDKEVYGLSGKEESLAKKSLSGEVKRTLETTYQNQTENSTVYRYLCTDGVDVWYEERLRQL